MWFELLLATLLCACVLYVPGFLFARALRMRRFDAVAVAPLFSVALLVAEGIVAHKAGVVMPAYALPLVALGICLACLVVSRVVARPAAPRGAHVWHSPEAESVSTRCCQGAGKQVLLYVGVALFVTVIVFLTAIDGPDSFSRSDDTAFHIAVIRGFLDSGSYSILNCSSFLDHGIAGGYYPGAWYVVAAVVASVFGDSVSLANNATIVVTMVLVFPLVMLFFFRQFFPGNTRLAYAGALVTPAFCGFPWGFLVFGQLFGNLLSWIFVMVALVFLARAIDARGAGSRARWVVCLVIALPVIAAAQPNGVFTFGIIAVAYTAWRIFFEPNAEHATFSRARILGVIGLVVAACVVWVGFYFAPPLQAVVEYETPATLSLAEGIASGLTFMFSTHGGIQPFLSVVVLLGIIRTCRKGHRRYLWMTAAFACAMLIYFVDVGTDWPIKHLLAGFWYSDYRRTGAMAALFAIPLAAMGLLWLIDACLALARRLRGGNKLGTVGVRVVASAVVVVMLVCQFAPLHVYFSEKRDIRMGLMTVRNQLTTNYSWQIGFTAEEDAFVQKVKDIVPEGALVVNLPNDGSCWSYGVEGLDTYWRRCVKNGVGSSDQDKLLRLHMKELSTSEDVQQAVSDLNIQYVLLLDYAGADNRTMVEKRYEAKDWVGIEEITDDTPGFTVVLSEGDMRLYAIDRSYVAE